MKIVEKEKSANQYRRLTKAAARENLFRFAFKGSRYSKKTK
jgi:hypothetical protein